MHWISEIHHCGLVLSVVVSNSSCIFNHSSRYVYSPSFEIIAKFDVMNCVQQRYFCLELEFVLAIDFLALYEDHMCIKMQIRVEDANMWIEGIMKK